ncbi:unnamed protein product [Rotaria socialis]|uniref:Uncharacterized protein n=1 Tax=Rotaria socialis TaxID=392032 RepID=A0A817VHX3_9BILA|nr:unnamed protein product [Rotaria socialis]CAF3322870.1 unnamed protein product [Rotaria socialis]CAF3347060.1 unnamed protein product [Rotaria socialis]CAF4452870.1 unnamed protein product [Rotaria socialis]CAF4537617.1 unnamed protein product [Rotaria socialis]
MAKRSITFLIIAVLLVILILLDILSIPYTGKDYDSTMMEAHNSSHFEFSFTSLNIAIIGSSGYIGSRLLHHLQKIHRWNVAGYDQKLPGQASRDIVTEDLQKFQVVVYLAGLTDRDICRDHPNDTEYKNVKDIYDLAKRMLQSQLLIFASTSEIAAGFGKTPMDELSPVQPHLFDPYVASIMRRENALRKLSLESLTAPRIVGLRFGLVIGLSDSQRIDFGHMQYICQAFLGGRLHVVHPEAYRSFLSMEDLLGALTVVIKNHRSTKRFDLFHLQSFSASVSNIANAIALRSGAHIFVSNDSLTNFSDGFSLNTKKFRTNYQFVFNGSQDKIISELINDVPRLCLGRQSRLDKGSTPCVVCGSHQMHLVLDLHKQPLANDFREQADQAMKCKQFPLRLVRCLKCHHTQLSYIVDRAYLFSHYLYQSGTSKSMKDYFEWLAEKVIKESEKKNGTVLEIASNDGSQLTEFLKRGWITIGVDPAENLAELARAKGHTVYIGFWGTDRFSFLPPPESLNAIVAQNVLAHVSNPVQFLRACAAVMGSRTRLYIQTSQCEMYETGQFDTVYHEHISFFTAHSFNKIAALAGLYIVHFEITPIHGRSCLVTFKRMRLPSTSFITSFQRKIPSSLLLALKKERRIGLTDAWFYTKYQAQADSMREWISRQLTHLHAQGHVIIGYGAAAKGMVLLHSLLKIPNQTWQFSYIVDEAPLKQDKYCPGTYIPVRPISELSKHSLMTPLTIVVFAWNFWEEILHKIRITTLETGIKNVFAIRPFPQQQLIQINSNSTTILTQNAYRLMPWPSPFPYRRRSVLLFSNLFNDTPLLSSWIRHHAPIFDIAILIDYDITNRSSQIVTNEAPSTWKIISPRSKDSPHKVINEEMRYYEKIYTKAWKIVLTTDEFMVHPNLREMLSDIERSSDVMALYFRSLIMIRTDSNLRYPFTSLLNQHTQYISYSPVKGKGSLVMPAYRYIHRYPYVEQIDVKQSKNESEWQWIHIGFIADYRYALSFQHTNMRVPFPEYVENVGDTMNEHITHDFNVTSWKHNKEIFRHIRLNDLQNFDAPTDELRMAHRLWKEMTNH